MPPRADATAPMRAASIAWRPSTPNRSRCSGSCLANRPSRRTSTRSPCSPTQSARRRSRWAARSARRAQSSSRPPRCTLGRRFEESPPAHLPYTPHTPHTTTPSLTPPLARKPSPVNPPLARNPSPSSPIPTYTPSTPPQPPLPLASPPRLTSTRWSRARSKACRRAQTPRRLRGRG